MKNPQAKVDLFRIEHMLVAIVIGVFAGTRLQIAIASAPLKTSAVTAAGLARNGTGRPTGFGSGRVTAGQAIAGDLTINGVFIPYQGSVPKITSTAVKGTPADKSSMKYQPSNPEGPTFLLVPIRPCLNPFFMTAKAAATSSITANQINSAPTGSR